MYLQQSFCHRHTLCCSALICLLFSSLLSAQNTALESSRDAPSYKEEQPVRAKHAMVVSIHHAASDAGLEILRQGGNAADAAVATGFALAVVYPVAGNLGGGGFMLLRMHDGSAHFLDFREKAPLAATETMYQDAHGDLIPAASTVGYRSIATPGSVAGLVYAEKKYGRLGLAKVIAPAIRLASEGYVLSAEEAHMLSDSHLAAFADSKRIFQRNGQLYQAGERFRQPELAHTLERIAKDPNDFYHGKMAQELIDSLKPGGSLLTPEDLAAYTVEERQPLLGTYHNYSIISAPPPSSGGVGLIGALNILEGVRLSGFADRSADWIHWIVEAYRRAYMDRGDYLGDPDYNSIPVAQLTSKDYAAAWRSGIDAQKASVSSTLSRPSGFLPAAPKTAGKRHESNDTTHYSIVDNEGNAVSVTTTLNGAFGSYVTAGTLGFLLNDEMDDFSAKAGVPNMFGLIQGPANAIAPGKRPLSSMTPTIILQDGKLRYVLGSPGGARIITTVANIFLSAAEGGLNIQQAVDAPRFHFQYLPDRLYLEPGFSNTLQEKLKAAGYSLVVQNNHWSDGECIAVDPVSGELLGGQDHRRGFGAAAGY